MLRENECAEARKPATVERERRGREEGNDVWADGGSYFNVSGIDSQLRDGGYLNAVVVRFKQEHGAL